MSQDPVTVWGRDASQGPWRGLYGVCEEHVFLRSGPVSLNMEGPAEVCGALGAECSLPWLFGGIFTEV